MDNKYIIAISKNDKREFEIGFIKSIFKPCEGYSWDMLEIDIKEKEEIIFPFSFVFSLIVLKQNDCLVEVSLNSFVVSFLTFFVEDNFVEKLLEL